MNHLHCFQQFSHQNDKYIVQCIAASIDKDIIVTKPSILIVHNLNII